MAENITKSPDDFARGGEAPAAARWKSSRDKEQLVTNQRAFALNQAIC
jgi:hypothetical protein